jgi:hypothetical protein
MRYIALLWHIVRKCMTSSYVMRIQLNMSDNITLPTEMNQTTVETGVWSSPDWVRVCSSSDTLHDTTESLPVWITPRASIIVSLGLWLYALTGLIVYSLFIVTVLCTRKLRTNAYFVLALTLGVCDCQFLLITVAYTCPSLYNMRVLGSFAHLPLPRSPHPLICVEHATICRWRNIWTHDWRHYSMGLVPDISAVYQFSHQPVHIPLSRCG